MVIRVDVDSEAGRVLAVRWRATFTPTFLLFDGAGRETGRWVARLDPGAVRAAMPPAVSR